MKKKILIIGGTGFFGYHLAKYFIKLKWDIASLSTSAPPKKRKMQQKK